MGPGAVLPVGVVAHASLVGDIADGVVFDVLAACSQPGAVVITGADMGFDQTVEVVVAEALAQVFAAALVVAAGEIAEGVPLVGDILDAEAAQYGGGLVKQPAGGGLIIVGGGGAVAQQLFFQLAAGGLLFNLVNQVAGGQVGYLVQITVTVEMVAGTGTAGG